MCDIKISTVSSTSESKRSSLNKTIVIKLYFFIIQTIKDNKWCLLQNKNGISLI
jgi:hypothetical protein